MEKQIIPQKLFSALKVVFVFIALFFFKGAIAQTQTFTSSGTFTVPAGVTTVQVEAWGGGGAGGGVASGIFPPTRAGGGGGGGAYAKNSSVTVIPGSTITVTVGAGGAGVGGADGNNGGSSSFGGLVTVSGGLGGKHGSTSPTNGAGGNGAFGTRNGGNGAAASGGNSGGGGGGAGTSGNGGNASGMTGGTGGSGGGGNGANGRSSNGDGADASALSGGGAGGRNSSSQWGSRTGGDGYRGQVIVTWVCPAYNITAISAVTPICPLPGTSVISLTGSVTDLPVGSYTVTYNRSLPAAAGLTTTMTVTTAGSGTFTATGLTTSGSPVITVTNLSSGAPGGICSSVISTNNSVSVTVNAAPSVSASNDGAVCAGQTIQLHAVASGVTFQWSGPSGFNSSLQDPSISGAAAANAGIYTVTATDPLAGCSATATTNVVVNALPTATASSNSPVCVGFTINLSTPSVSGASYAWTGPDGFTSSIRNPSISNAQIVNDGSYTVVVTSSAGCTNTSSVTVAVNNAPIASASSNAPVCTATTLNLNASPSGATYAWSGPAGYTSSTQNPTRSNATLAMNGTYTVTVTLGGCSSTATTTVVVNQAPTGTPTVSNATVCEGSAVTLNANQGLPVSYSASPNVSIPDNNVSGVNSTITIPAQTIASATQLKIGINLTHTYSGDVIAKVTSPGGVITVFDRLGVPASSFGNGQNFGGYYEFDVSAGSVLPESNSGPTTIPAGTYAPSNTNGSINTNWSGISFPMNAGGNWVLNMSDRASGDVGTIVSWTVTIMTSSGITYTWTSTPNGFNSTDENPSATVTGTTTYNLAATANGCTANTTVGVSATPGPLAIASSNAPVCDGNDINFIADNLAGGQGSGNSYQWYDPNNLPFSSQQNPNIFSATSAYNGTYTVVVTNQYLCTATTTVQVDVNPNPVINVSTQINVNCFGESNGSITTNTSNGTGPYSYTYDFVNFNTTGEFDLLPAGSYTIYVSDANACQNTVTATITEPALLQFTKTYTDQQCPSTFGSITMNATGGTTPYMYSYDNGSTYVNNNANLNLTAGSYNVMVQDAHMCATSTQQQDLILVNTPSTAALSVSSQNGTELCIGGSTTLSAVGGSLGSTADWKWYKTNCGTTPVGSGPSITVNPSSSTSYYVRAEDVCGATPCADLSLAITVGVPSAAVTVPMTGMPLNACVGTTANLSINAVNNTTQDVWDAPIGSYFDGNPLNVSPYTTSSPNVQVTFGSPNGSFYNVGVQAANACGSTLRKIQKVRGIVSVPATVLGPQTVCENTSNVAYNIAPITGASQYQWSITGDATVTGNGTNVNIDFGPTWNGGTLCVAAQTSCYTSASKCISLSKSAGIPNNLSGNFTACPNTSQTYSVTPLQGAAVYNWTLPTGASGSSNNNSINVTFGNGYNNIGNVCVSVTSICGVTSALKCKTVAPGIPMVPPAITGITNGLCNQSVAYSTPIQTGTSYNWTAPAGANVFGQGNNSVNIQFSTMTTGQVCVVASNTCGTSAPRCVAVKGAPNPPTDIIALPSSWCANTQGIELTANISNTTGSYTLDWGYPSAPVATYVAGGGNSNSLTLDWGTGNGVIAITASNACGSATKTYNATTNCRESEELTAANFNMYPNPASDVVNIEFWSDKDGMQKDLKVLDLSGRTVMVQKIQTISGRQSVQISLAQFAKGVYMIELNYQRNKLVIE